MESSAINKKITEQRSPVSFLIDIPLEIRQQVYRYFFEDGQQLLHAESCIGCDADVNRPTHDAQGLRQTCRQVRNEAEPYIWPSTLFVMAACISNKKLRPNPSWPRVQKLSLANEQAFNRLSTTFQANDYPLLNSLTCAMLLGNLRYLNIEWELDMDNEDSVHSLRTLLTLCRGTELTCVFNVAHSYLNSRGQKFRMEARVSIVKTYKVTVNIRRGLRAGTMFIQQMIRCCYGLFDWQRTSFTTSYDVEQDYMTVGLPSSHLVLRRSDDITRWMAAECRRRGFNSIWPETELGTLE